MPKLSLLFALLLLVLCCFNSTRCDRRHIRERRHSQSSLNRIVGGKPASVGQWPWQAAVLVINSSSSSSELSFLCGGTLIGPRWVISAAHCFSRKDLLESGIKTIFGEDDVGISGSTRQLRNVSRYINHPSYNWRTNFADISLLKLETAVIYNDFVQPAVLPNSTARVKSGQFCVISGYGYTNGQEKDQGVLNYAHVQIIPLDTCKRWYSESNISIPDSHVCAGRRRGGVDSCYGDSGGPLVCGTLHAKSTGYFLVGVTSFGEECAKRRRPGVYTNVIRHLDWIKQYNVTTSAPMSEQTTNGSIKNATTSTETLTSPQKHTDGPAGNTTRLPRHSTTDGGSAGKATSPQNTTNGSEAQIVQNSFVLLALALTQLSMYLIN